MTEVVIEGKEKPPAELLRAAPKKVISGAVTIELAELVYRYEKGLEISEPRKYSKERDS